MSGRSVFAGFFRRVVSVTVMVASVLMLGVGRASADPVAGSASGGPRVLGVPLGTASWALFGLVVLLLGLVAASRSGHQAARTSEAVAPKRTEQAVKAEPRPTEEPASVFGRSVSAV